MRIFVIILILLVFEPLSAQKLYPPIYNYKISDYGAAPQNWEVSVDKMGAIYVANNEGLLHFNGADWQLYKLPNATIIRSVKVIDDKIYTGSYEEFGYWKKNSYGLLDYHSLSDLIEGHTFSNEEIWEIVTLGNRIYFRSFSKIYEYHNNVITPIDTPFSATDLFVFEESLYVAGDVAGIFKLEDGILLPIKGSEIFKGRNVNSLSDYKGNLIVGTKLQGSFVFSDNEFTPWKHPLNNFLKNYQLNKILKISDSTLVFGTIKKGLFILSTQSGEFINLDRERGLQNNTVLAMTSFKDQLWIGLDNGLDRIKIKTPITYYTDYSGALGTVYDLEVYKGTIFIGSNTGLYYLENNKLHFIEGSQGHVWDLKKIENTLLAGHNTGTFLVTKQGVSKLSNYAGGYQIINAYGNSNTFLQGTYNGVILYEKSLDQTWVTKAIKGIDFPVKQLVFEGPRTLWAAHPYKGFYRLLLSEDLSEVIDSQGHPYYSNINPYNVKVYNIKNRIVLRSKDNWYTYNSILDQFDLFNEFDLYANMEIIHKDDDVIWFLSNKESREIIATDLKKNLLSISEKSLQNRLVHGTEKLISIDPNTSFITLNDGFGKISQDKLDEFLMQIKVQRPILNFFSTQSNYLVLSDNFEIPFKNAQTIEIKVSSPELISPNYQYQLKGPRSESQIIKSGYIQFQNLPFGEYKLEFSAINMNGIASIPNSISFSIKPPWYWTPLALISYLVTFIFIVLSVRAITKIKIKRKQRQVEMRMKQEQEEAILALEKDKLAKEIKLKQNELTGTTLVIAKKNELLLELKDVILKNANAFKTDKVHSPIISKIEKSIDHSGDWDSFEIHFKQLHQDFFEKMLVKFPSLTPKDLKLAAYLKMNLSSKEIAPLMGISIRGVEIHRYRLRKKLQLDNSIHLSNFLITFE